MKILLLGKNGQVGRRLKDALVPLGHLICLGKEDVDFLKPESLKIALELHRPQIIINAAAYTAVEKAEYEADIAYQINAAAPGELAYHAAKNGSLLVHYSTDYVFDGRKIGEYNENDESCPLNIYGKTKLEGERSIITSGCKYLIFRTSWVFDSLGQNFPKTILKAAAFNEYLDVVSDQIGTPTSAKLIANVTAFVLQQLLLFGYTQFNRIEEFYGIYNLTGKGSVSWYEFAKILLQHASLKGFRLQCREENIRPILSANYSSKALRPLNSRLDTNKLEQKFGFFLPKWDIYLPSLIDDLVEPKKAI